VNAALRAYHSLLERANANQVSTALDAAFESADQEDWWGSQEFCRWFVLTTTDWTQYQYRYVMPKMLVDMLVTIQDAPSPTPKHFALASMINTVFASPTPLVNLSTSNIMTCLLVLLIRRTSIDPMDELLAPLVRCIASLGTHIYYQDQIYDLAEELVGRLVSIQVNGLLGRGRTGSEQGREQGMRCLLAALQGLLRTADRQESAVGFTTLPTGGNENAERSPLSPDQGTYSLDAEGPPGNGATNRPSRRTRVSPEIWLDSLALLCEADYAVRADYARALVRFICIEISKEPFAVHVDSDVDGSGERSVGKVACHLSTRRAIPGIITADPISRFLNALHASLFTLATTSSLGLTSSPAGSAHSSSHQLPSPPILNVIAATPTETPNATERPEASVVAELRDSPTPSQSDHAQSQQPSKSRPSMSLNTPRPRKLSVPLSLLDPGLSSGRLPAATPSDYSLLLHILTTIHERLPGRALLTGVPMLIALHVVSLQQNDTEDSYANEKRHAVRELLARIWAVIGRVWECEEVSAIAQKVITFDLYSGDNHLPIKRSIRLFHLWVPPFFLPRHQLLLSFFNPQRSPQTGPEYPSAQPTRRTTLPLS
jgi:protein EFR3